MHVNALITLQADEISSEHLGDSARQLGLADTDLTLEKQRLTKLKGEK